MGSYITANMRSKFQSFQEYMKPCLDKLLEPEVFGVRRSAEGKLIATGVRGKEIFGEMKNEIAIQAMNILATMSGTIIADEKPFIEGEIPMFGHRFSGTIPGISQAATFTIRKKASKLITLEEMVTAEFNTIDSSAIPIISSAIEEQKNILVVGGPSSGKTTMTNAILKKISELDPDSLIHTVERVRELIVSSWDHELWELPPTMVNGKEHPVDIVKLVELALRRDPGRFIMGEIRNPDDAAGVLLFWNSGQPGGVATIHADSASRGLIKVEQYINASRIMQANPDLIASTFNIIISIQNCEMKDEKGRKIGKRIEEILEVHGYIEETKRYHTTPLYTYAANANHLPLNV